MIPKKIHYCWFGGNPKPESFYICLDSWKKIMPDYEIIEWNESNFDINCCTYVKLAAESKKWAFVSDYARALALFEQGGIYMDIDVEVKFSLDEFLVHRDFSGFEIKGSPFTVLWATEAGHPCPKNVLDFYDKKTDFDLTTNTIFQSEYFNNQKKLNPINYRELFSLEINAENYITQKINWITFDPIIKASVAKRIKFNENLQANQEYNYLSKMLFVTNKVKAYKITLTKRRFDERSIQGSLIKTNDFIEKGFLGYYHTYRDVYNNTTKASKQFLLNKMYQLAYRKNTLLQQKKQFIYIQFIKEFGLLKALNRIRILELKKI